MGYENPDLGVQHGVGEEGRHESGEHGLRAHGLVVVEQAGADEKRAA
jgi:hypothetical protein